MEQISVTINKFPEHNEEIYKGLLGLTDKEIGNYKEKGII